jgi:hydroxypyruvate isomerase
VPKGCINLQALLQVREMERNLKSLSKQLELKDANLVATMKDLANAKAHIVRKGLLSERQRLELTAQHSSATEAMRQDYAALERTNEERQQLARAAENSLVSACKRMKLLMVAQDEKIQEVAYWKRRAAKRTAPKLVAQRVLSMFVE